jgi:hypothetical protein
MLVTLGTRKVSLMFGVKTAAFPLTHRRIRASGFSGGGEIVFYTTGINSS